jgi:hypothetical protein
MAERQLRVVGLGNYGEYYSYFLLGIMQGTFLNGHLFRAVPLFGQSLNQVYEQVTWFKPHIVMCHMIFNKQPHNQKDVLNMMKKIRGHGTKVYYHAGDARPTPRFEGNITSCVDAALCNHNLMEKYQNIWQVPCYYWPYQGLNQNNIVPVESKFNCSVGFAGSLADNVHHSPRARFINGLKQHIEVKCFPTPDSGNTRFQTAEFSSSANVILGYQMGLDIPGYIDVRPWQHVGAGALFFQDRCADNRMNKFFKEGVHYVAFERDNVQDFVSKYNYYVNEFPEKAMQIKQTGFDYVQNYHSSKNRMESVFSLYNTGQYYIYALSNDGDLLKVNNPWK